MNMLTVLGIDLGTNSIGFCLIKEFNNTDVSSEIIKMGSRIIPLSSDEQNDFKKGKAISINADRRVKRSIRRNLQRYQQRRKHLQKILFKSGIISDQWVLPETGKNSTHSLWRLRSQCASEKVSLDDFARILFSINKKRGYKSNRIVKEANDGRPIDGMTIAKKLYEESKTPGQLTLELLKNDQHQIPSFYPSDLNRELEQIWKQQSKFYPDQITKELFEKIKGKNGNQIFNICKDSLRLDGIQRSGKKKELQLETYQWRVSALIEQIPLEHFIIVIQDIVTQINGSSGYLGSISDRSKALYFNKQTIGEYLYEKLKNNPHYRLKNQVFYRQDYLDEFETIWENQAKYHPVLTPELKADIRDTIIFYQRRLKSQKALLGVCELEGKWIKVEKNGKQKSKFIGPKVCPKSSPIFQTYKIWQKLNDLKFNNTFQKNKIEIADFDPRLELRNLLFDELSIGRDLSESKILGFSGLKKSQGWTVNFKNGIQGNTTNRELFKVFEKILNYSGHEIEFNKLSPKKVNESLREVFSTLGISTKILSFNPLIYGKEMEKQAAYQFWHLLYSYEGDESKTGNEILYKILKNRFDFPMEYAKLVGNIILNKDYSELSAKAMNKITPFMIQGKQFSEAATEAGYNHSHSLTTEERKDQPRKDKLEIIPKNTLRNPVVEKILNQLVNVVNTLTEEYGSIDVIRVEMTRELKMNAKDRDKMTSDIEKANKRNQRIKEKLKSIPPFSSGVRVTMKDIIKYKLWEELEHNGFKTLYTQTYVPLEQLYLGNFDVEHIIPKAKLFDDSFSNKTISTRIFNEKKGNKTAIDAVEEYFGANSKESTDYRLKIESLSKKKEISKSKFKKLLMTEKEIPEDFIERDLKNTQYIAKKAFELLDDVCGKVEMTIGSVTSRLREDWGLNDVLKELNWDKYKALGLVEYQKNKHGNLIGVIKEWSKRNDHRHQALDGLVVAFTHPEHIQYLNFLNARKNLTHKQHKKIKGIEDKHTTLINGKYVINPPFDKIIFRKTVKKHLEGVLVSFKAKNKVTTKNKNRIKTKTGRLNFNTTTPRGQLHKETIYGLKKHYKTKMERIGSKFDQKTINKVSNCRYRKALSERLIEFQNDPKKAFTGNNALSKKPIFIDELKSIPIPEKVKLVELTDYFSIRKDITPDLNIDKVIDIGARNVLKKRLEEYGNDPKKAFSNLEEKPIWMVKPKSKDDWKYKDSPKPHELGIPLKRVTITGVSNAIPIHFKKDHLGIAIKNKEGNPTAIDYVSTGNNHHTAIYRDAEGKLQDQVVSFFEAVVRKNQGLSIVDKSFNQHLGWKFLFSMKQNEMFVFPNPEQDFDPNQTDLTNENNNVKISQNLFRVQKMSRVTYGNSIVRDYVFRHHLDTRVEEKSPLKEVTFKKIKSLPYLSNIVKVRINHIGQIVQIGEY